MDSEKTKFFDAVYAAVRSIPPGCVRSYGQVALMVGAPGAARQVGWALHMLPEGSDVPWHRVVNSKGEISLSGGLMGEAERQRARLEAEGVVFDDNGRIDLNLHF
ncbi:MAG TPA: MGMT family protein [Acidobacteriota bacterium]|nr:MGMT family protein [Acidobacteriota bacterium]